MNKGINKSHTLLVNYNSMLDYQFKTESYN